MQIKLSVPSKTFLFGEYLALRGGLCATLQTEPRFELHVKQGGEGRCEGIHPHSPAGQWVRQNSAQFAAWDMEFRDPHQGRGGFGASSAQFVMVYVAGHLMQTRPQDWSRSLGAEKVWRKFREVATASEGEAQPSGADVVGQYLGGVSRFSFQPFQVKSQDWPFADLDFALLRTGKKISTHEHLKLLKDRPFHALVEPVNRLTESLKTHREELFLQAFKRLAQALEEESLLAEESREQLKILRARPEVLAAKGCGALGADTLLLLYRPQQRQAIEVLAEGMGLELVATRSDLSPGLQVNLDWLDLAQEGPSQRQEVAKGGVEYGV